MKTVKVGLPKGRDPFVNARLQTLSGDEQGRERYWITSVNGSQGSTGVLITEDGEYRLYRFKKPFVQYAYSSGQEDPNTLWLCVNLTHMARLDLRTGNSTHYPTGAPGGFVCGGGVLDPATDKFFAIGYVGEKGTTAISFDIRTKQCKVHYQAAPDQFLYSCQRLPDGTYVGLVVCPGASIVHWDPRAETVTPVRVVEPESGKDVLQGAHPRFVMDEQNRLYLPGRGWYDFSTRAFVDGPRPEKEANWIVRQGRQVFGCDTQLGEGHVYGWDLDTGKVRHITAIPSCYAEGITLSRNGKLISINITGEFRRHDPATGRMELYRRLPTEAVNGVDHILRLDRNRLLGSYFITQRFWEINLKTGHGFDCGRAAPGGGQIQNFWKVGKKVYMTSYTTGTLMEYDPSQHPHFPENPHVVAEPPHSMRPVAFAQDGRFLYYASNAEYGQLGGTLTRYDAKTGLYRYQVNPIKDQAIWSMWLDKPRGVLLAHTTFRSDCNSCPAPNQTTHHARIRAEDLSLVESFAFPDNMHVGGILGLLDRRRLLGCYWYSNSDKPLRPHLAPIDLARFTPPEDKQLILQPAEWRSIRYGGRPGIFVILTLRGVELWNLATWTRISVLKADKTVYRIQVQDRSVYLFRPRDLVILENAL